MVTIKKSSLLIMVCISSLLSLAACNKDQKDNNTNKSVKKEESIKVKEDHTYSIPDGLIKMYDVSNIADGSVSEYNSVVDFKKIDQQLEEKYNKEKEANNEASKNNTQETVYVEDAYYEHVEESETTVVYQPELTAPAENTESNQIYAGAYSITAYTWTGNPMANGEYPYVGCAASCDLPIGTVINIVGLGTYVIKDVCPTSGVIDIYMSSYDQCIQFGRQYRDVYFVN